MTSSKFSGTSSGISLNRSSIISSLFYLKIADIRALSFHDPEVVLTNLPEKSQPQNLSLEASGFCSCNKEESFLVGISNRGEYFLSVKKLDPKLVKINKTFTGEIYLKTAICYFCAVFNWNPGDFEGPVDSVDLAVNLAEFLVEEAAVDRPPDEDAEPQSRCPNQQDPVELHLSVCSDPVLSFPSELDFPASQYFSLPSGDSVPEYLDRVEKLLTKKLDSVSDLPQTSLAPVPKRSGSGLREAPDQSVATFSSGNFDLDCEKIFKLGWKPKHKFVWVNRVTCLISLSHQRQDVKSSFLELLRWHFWQTFNCRTYAQSV